MFVELQAGVKLTCGPELILPACIVVGHALDFHRTVLSVFAFRRCFPHQSFAHVNAECVVYTSYQCRTLRLSGTKHELLVPAFCDVKSLDWGKNVHTLFLR